MKIGVLTFHYAYNYGAFLQAFALQKFLEDLGHEVEFVNYHNYRVEQDYKLFKFRSFPLKNPYKAIGYIITKLYRKNKFLSFRKFVYDNLNISHRVKDFNDLALLGKDIVIVGSDQLWNKTITGDNDPFYWAQFSKNCNIKAITYAICMNADNICSSDYDFISNNLSNFSALSVRESSLVSILQPFTDLKINISVDPTLIIDPNVWKSISNNQNSKYSKNVLVYAILERNKVIEMAQTFASSLDIPLVIMNPIAESKALTKDIQPSTPFGFLSAIAHADYIFTSSFHGLVFSLIFHKEVFVMGNSGKNERMKSLLGYLGISERFIDDKRTMPRIKIDYTIVDERLNIMRENSRNYLYNALKNES